MRPFYAILAVAGSAVMSFGVFIGTAEAIVTGVSLAFTDYLKPDILSGYLEPDMFSLVLAGVVGNPYFWLGGSAMGISLFGLSACPVSPDELPEAADQISLITE